MEFVFFGSDCMTEKMLSNISKKNIEHYETCCARYGTSNVRQISKDFLELGYTEREAQHSNYYIKLNDEP